jgi:D-amino-acid oxidase
VLINSPVYLKWLQSKFEVLGGKIVRQDISHIDQVVDLIDKNIDQFAVINCTGLGARFLGGVQDSAVYPTRGQTVIVKAPHIKKTITHVGK